MTREMLLELHDGVYCEKVQKEHEGKLVDWFKKTLCAEFVKLLVSGEPERIKVVVNDKGERQEGFVEVKVMKCGHYRWWFSFGEGLAGKNSTFGLYRTGEEILTNMFPNDFDEREKDGKWKAVIFLKDDGTVGVEEHRLWVMVVVL